MFGNLSRVSIFGSILLWHSLKWIKINAWHGSELTLNMKMSMSGCLGSGSGGSSSNWMHAVMWQYQHSSTPTYTYPFLQNSWLSLKLFLVHSSMKWKYGKHVNMWVAFRTTNYTDGPGSVCTHMQWTIDWWMTNVQVKMQWWFLFIVVEMNCVIKW